MVSTAFAVASPATAEALEFPSLLALHAECAATEAGRQRVLDLEPLTSRAELEHRHRLFRDSRAVLEEGSLVPVLEGSFATLLDGLRGAERAITGTQLLQLAEALQVVRQAAHRVRSCERSVPDLEALFEPLPDGEPLRHRIFKSLNKRGRVRDDASPKLVELRRRVHRIRDGLYKLLQQTLSQHQDHFSDDTVSLKDGRLTLLMHAGARGRVDGLVHGRSGTGQSLYFEPLSAVEGNNGLQETLAEEEAERQRILSELIGEARRELPLIEGHLAILGELDLLQSLCRFAERSGSELPEIAEGRDLGLIEARHPLLDPELAPLREAALGQAGHVLPIVPLNLELDSEQRVLVVTGPNAGGKTVALKTVGLLSLAAQCGLPIPAQAGSRLPMFSAVMAMVGDEQDLLADRSTFSARLLRLKEAWEVAGERSLVLLDELGSGTDPEEGSALAVALLEGLLETGTLSVLTTHLTQLAAVALEREGATCAAMEFDPDSGEPTFHLRPGAPGGSRALALAERLGLPKPWLMRAESLLGVEHRNLRSLLEEVESVRRQLAATQAQLQGQLRDLERERLRLDEEATALAAERKRVHARLRGELEEFRGRVTKKLRDELARLQQEVEEGRKKGLVSGAAGRLFEGAPELGTDEEAGGPPPQIGNDVRHRSLGWQGKLAGVRDDTAEVVVHGKRVRCALEDLAAVRENADDKPHRPPPVESGQAEQTAGDVPSELKLLGLRVEPALEALDRYLDRALLSSYREVRIVHGFGSGRLRQAVREHLGSHPAVARFRAGRSGEGGDGATVVTLDKS